MVNCVLVSWILENVWNGFNGWCSFVTVFWDCLNVSNWC